MFFWDKIKSFSALYEHLTAPIKKQYNLTQMEFDILMFLHNNPQYKTANDIVNVRHLTKSHVSTSVASLERRGLIKRGYMEGNRKSIMLEITSNASKIIHDGKKAQEFYGETLIKGFSENEKEQFITLFKKICYNVDSGLEG